MEWITLDSVVKCGHRGKLVLEARQEWVRIGVPVLVDDDPEGREINGCPNSGPNIKRCGRSLRVKTGYSEWIRVDERAVVLSHLDGFTDGTPPGAVHYNVTDPRQDLVRADL